MKAKLSELGSRQSPSDITRLMAIALERPDILSLAAGFTDNASLPMEDVGAVVDDFASSGVDGKSVLQYGSNKGRERLREMLARRTEEFDIIGIGNLDRSRFFISNGSQQSLYLAIQTLCDPGDFVLVEEPTYFVFLEILSGLGVKPIGMPMTSNGDVDAAELARLLEEANRGGWLARIKALYLVSYFANPTGHCVSQESKQSIGELLNQLDTPIAVIEDAAYRELYYKISDNSKSCLALDSFKELPVLYTSTLTKPYASGLKVGYAYCSDREWTDAMMSVKGQQDFGTANFAQAIVERALEKGDFDRHLDSLRSIYEEKMRALHDSLFEPLSSMGWEWSVPSGGLYLWLKSPHGLVTDAESQFHAACLEAGVFYVPGDLCYPEGRIKDRIRLSFGVLSCDLLKVAAERFVQAARTMTKSARV